MINLKVYSLEGTMFEGEVEAISSVNEKGEFDILPQHANFISIIKDKLVLHLSESDQKEFSLELGIVKHYQDKTKVYLGIETSLEKIPEL